jgi:hypothetical protein
VRYELKTPWRNGTTHVEFEPIDFIAKLAALVPPPRAHLTRFHGIFAPNANLRAQLTPAGRGRRPATDAALADGPAPYPQGVIHAWPISQNTARWRRRATGPDRADHPLRLRECRQAGWTPAVKSRNEHDAATPPQRCARAAGGAGARKGETACRGDAAGHETRSKTPDLRRTGRLRDRRLPGRPPGKGG